MIEDQNIYKSWHSRQYSNKTRCSINCRPKDDILVSLNFLLLTYQQLIFRLPIISFIPGRSSFSVMDWWPSEVTWCDALIKTLVLEGTLRLVCRYIEIRGGYQTPKHIEMCLHDSAKITVYLIYRMPYPTKLSEVDIGTYLRAGEIHLSSGSE